jgi:hypothetical protein
MSAVKVRKGKGRGEYRLPPPFEEYAPMRRRFPTIPKRETEAGADRRMMNPYEEVDTTRMICLHGLYVFDPDRSTPDDFRQFLWAGLRLLEAEARAKGLNERQVRSLLLHAFDRFHESADDLWTTLKGFVAKRKSTPKIIDQNNQCIACEEDRPVLIEMERREPITLIDPDAALLEAWES